MNSQKPFTMHTDSIAEVRAQYEAACLIPDNRKRIKNPNGFDYVMDPEVGKVFIADYLLAHTLKKPIKRKVSSSSLSEATEVTSPTSPPKKKRTRKGKEEYGIVEAIVSHDEKMGADAYFQVKWVGFDTLTMEPPEYVNHLEIHAKYCYEWNQNNPNAGYLLPHKKYKNCVTRNPMNRAVLTLVRMSSDEESKGSK